MSLSRKMYKATRTVRTLEQVSRGRAAPRAKNIAIGRGIARSGGWRRLWGGRR